MCKTYVSDHARHTLSAAHKCLMYWLKTNPNILLLYSCLSFSFSLFFFTIIRVCLQMNTIKHQMRIMSYNQIEIAKTTIKFKTKVKSRVFCVRSNVSLRACVCLCVCDIQIRTDCLNAFIVSKTIGVQCMCALKVLYVECLAYYNVWRCACDT